MFDLYIINVNEPRQAKMSIRIIRGQRRHRSDSADAQSDQSLHCPLTESLDTMDCINLEQRPGWDLAHAQDDVNLHI